MSLVIPVYNAEDYIIRTLDNALAQSLLGLEIIAVDDGCKDSTPDILGWYAEKYSNVEVVHKENGGVAAARNTGIEAAKGEYIGFMDNDDMIHPDMMKKLYDSAKKNDCDIAVTSVYIIQNDGYKIWLQYQMEEDKAVSVEKFFHMHYVHSCTHGLVLWNKLYRTSIVKLHALPSLMGDEDVAWTPYILSHASRICYLNGYFYEWDRIIRDSTLGMKLGKKTKEECVRSYKEAIMFYLRNGNPQKIELLKEVAMTQLFTLSAWYAYPEFEELRKQINETF